MASKSYDKIVDICDDLILQARFNAGITFLDELPYSIHLLGHIYIDDMKSTGINYGCKSIPKKKLICKSIPKKKFINHIGIQLLDKGVLFSAVRVLKKRLLAMLKTEHVPPGRLWVRVKLGESALAFYTAENQSSTPITSVSTYNVTPMKLVFGSSFTFKSDLAKFNMTCLEDDVVALMKKRVIDLAGCLGKTVKVDLNGQRIPVKSFLDSVNLYLQSASKARPDALPRIAEKVNDRWEICVSLTEGQFQQGGYSGLSFALVASKLKEKSRVVAMDLRGYGKSSTENELDLSIECQTEDP
ncbi:unnamed protein product [Camellia sinensis]